MVEAMRQIGIETADIGKAFAIHQHAALGGGWDVAARDGQTCRFREHVAPTVRNRSGPTWAIDPILAPGPLEIDSWVQGLGAPDFQHTPGTVASAQGFLRRMNAGNAQPLLAGLQQRQPAVYNHLIGDGISRGRLTQLGVQLPPPPEWGWLRLRGTQSQDSFVFYQGLARQYRTGAIIEFGYGQGPFPGTPFDTAGRGLTGPVGARTFLAGLP